MSDWFKDWFASEEYLNVYRHRDTSEAEKFIDLILSNINITEDSYILDAACGAGRHVNVLAVKGYKVIGFDLSLTLLKIAQRNTNPEHRTLFFQSDIRNICLKQKFDLILNLFTSFGYFESDEENFSFPMNAYQFLLQDGYYIFDYFNSKFVAENLVSYSEKEIDGKIIKESRKIENSRVIKEISVISDNSEQKYFESVKMYSYKDLLERFNKIGFSEQKIFGNYDGSEFDPFTSPRFIVIFKK